MFVFGQKPAVILVKWLYLGKLVCLWANWFYLGKVVLFEQQVVFIWANVVVFEQIGFHLGKLLLFGQKSGCIWAKGGFYLFSCFGKLATMLRRQRSL